jgi:hypothetical protein
MSLLAAYRLGFGEAGDPLHPPPLRDGLLWFNAAVVVISGFSWLMYQNGKSSTPEINDMRGCGFLISASYFSIGLVARDDTMPLLSVIELSLQ